MTPELIILTVLASAGVLAVAYVIIRASALLKIGWKNRARLKEIEQEANSTEDPLHRKALEAVKAQCESLKKQWILREADLAISSNTHAFVDTIATACHPESDFPLAEARLGSLLDAFDEMRQKTLVLSRMQGLRQVTQFRLRHVQLLIRAWRKKEEWQSSALGQTVSKYRVLFWLKWLYALFRFFDVTFWAFKTLGALAHHVVFKVLLIRWYLTVGELALKVYSDSAGDSEIEAESLLKDLHAVPSQQGTGPLPQTVRDIADASRKKIWFNAKTLDVPKLQTLYADLVYDIAQFHHPNALNPLYEVKLNALLLGISRLSEDVAALRDKPVLKKLLKVRLAQAMRIKRTADRFLGSDLWSWMKKYRVPRVMKYSTLIFKALKKKHPGILFKDFAFLLVEEGSKRWAAIYLHDRIVREVNITYEETPP